MQIIISQIIDIMVRGDTGRGNEGPAELQRLFGTGESE